MTEAAVNDAGVVAACQSLLEIDRQMANVERSLQTLLDGADARAQSAYRSCRAYPARLERFRRRRAFAAVSLGV